MTPERRHHPEVEPEPATQQDDAAEPAGEQEAGNEAEREGATDRPQPLDADAGEEVGGDEPAGPAGGDESGDGTAPDEAEDELARISRERDEYLSLAQRTQADLENYRKRAAREAASAGQRAKGNLIRELLPVVDNLERALGSAEESEQHLSEGVRLVHTELLAVLQRGGVEPFDPTGEAFDPNLHEALATREQDGAKPGLVLDVAEKGYSLNGTVLRPARVVVAG